MRKVTVSESIEKKNVSAIIAVFVILQPLLDYYILFTDDVKKYTYISPSTIIRILFVSILFMWTLYLERHNKKTIIVCLAYLTGSVIYFLLHQLICSAFPLQLPDNFLYKTKDELNYVVRIVIPIAFLFSVYKQEMTFDLIKRITLVLSLIIGIMFIVSNLGGFSLVAYSENFDVSKHTFLDWFKSSSYAFSKDLTSKGLFYKGNQISGVLVLLLPVNLMFYLNKRSVTGFFSILIIMFCMFMTGSRASLYGMVISLISIICIKIFVHVIKRERVDVVTLLLYSCFVAFFLAIYPFSPRHTMTVYENERYIEYEKTPLSSVQDPIKETNPEENPSINHIRATDINNLIARLGQVSIPDVYYKTHYPVQHDYQFWKNLDNLSYSEYSNSRQQQNLITMRIFDRIHNSKWKYTLFGMGRSRFASSSILIENDFIQQKYTLGLIGIAMFFLPYLLAIIFIAVKITFHMKKLLTFESLALLFSSLLFLFVSVFTGHLIDELFPVLIFVFYLGYLCGKIANENIKNKNVNVKGLLLPVDSK